MSSYVAEIGKTVSTRTDGSLEDHLRMRIEEHGFADNLMLDGAIQASRASVVRVDAGIQDLFTNLDGFRTCVTMVNKALGA